MKSNANDHGLGQSVLPAVVGAELAVIGLHDFLFLLADGFGLVEIHGVGCLEQLWKRYSQEYSAQIVQQAGREFLAVKIVLELLIQPAA